MTNFSFGRTDGRTERGNNNIPELSLESAGIINCLTLQRNKTVIHEITFQQTQIYVLFLMVRRLIRKT